MGVHNCKIFYLLNTKTDIPRVMSVSAVTLTPTPRDKKCGYVRRLNFDTLWLFWLFTLARTLGLIKSFPSRAFSSQNVIMLMSLLLILIFYFHSRKSDRKIGKQAENFKLEKKGISAFYCSQSRRLINFEL
jgi:hypothetical protein